MLDIQKCSSHFHAFLGGKADPGLLFYCYNSYTMILMQYFKRTTYKGTWGWGNKLVSTYDPLYQCRKLGIVVHNCDPSTRKAETGISPTHGLDGHSKSVTSRFSHCLKNYRRALRKVSTRGRHLYPSLHVDSYTNMHIHIHTAYKYKNVVHYT